MSKRADDRVLLLAVPVLLALLVSWQSSRARAQTGGPGPPGAGTQIAALQTQWHAGDTAVRLKVLKRLQRLGPRGEAAVPLLVEALQDRDPKIRSEAAMALHRIGPAGKPSVPDL